MFTPVETFLAWRYTRSRQRSRFVSLIAAISIGGVALGMAALITILSIMNGFERELRDRILGTTAHVTVAPSRGALIDWQSRLTRLASLPDVLAVAPLVTGDALLTRLGEVQGVRLRGVDPVAEQEVSVIGDKMRAGSFDALQAGAFNVVLGRGLADALGAAVGDDVTMVLPQPIRTAAGVLPRLKRLHVAGVFEAGVQEYDTATVYLHMADAARIVRLAEGVSNLQLRLRDPFLVDALRGAIVDAMGSDGIVVRDWTETHTNLFRALKTEKIVMFVILLLSIGVAAFNLVSTLSMVVAEKHTEVAVLQTIGMTPWRILRVFLTQGALIGIAGVVIGTVAGVGLSLNVETLVGAAERAFGFKILSPDVYYISEIPSQLEFPDVAAAVVIALLLCLLAPLFPAWAASRTRPAEALRYE